ncbi:hypothetical protein [Streptomyces sp. LS1784]|uniref:hypothetical protein n=1 Tax=Streptomyces sp. LS1784 TaxID=2851533 RepID=UPI001CCB88D9|nr:hypothetical protein [Streptomyces sp. LS1784]
MHPNDKPTYEAIDPQQLAAIEASFDELGAHIRSLPAADEAAPAEASKADR